MVEVSQRTLLGPRWESWSAQVWPWGEHISFWWIGPQSVHPGLLSVWCYISQPRSLWACCGSHPLTSWMSWSLSWIERSSLLNNTCNLPCRICLKQKIMRTNNKMQDTVIRRIPLSFTDKIKLLIMLIFDSSWEKVLSMLNILLWKMFIRCIYSVSITVL